MFNFSLTIYRSVYIGVLMFGATFSIPTFAAGPEDGAIGVQISVRAMRCDEVEQIRDENGELRLSSSTIQWRQAIDMDIWDHDVPAKGEDAVRMRDRKATKTKPGAKNPEKNILELKTVLFTNSNFDEPRAMVTGRVDYTPRSKRVGVEFNFGLSEIQAPNNVEFTAGTCIESADEGNQLIVVRIKRIDLED